MIHPCRGWLSCRVDWIMTLISMALVVLLNLAVFDEVMLCRRWIGWVNIFERRVVGAGAAGVLARVRIEPEP